MFACTPGLAASCENMYAHEPEGQKQPLAEYSSYVRLIVRGKKA